MVDNDSEAAAAHAVGLGDTVEAAVRRRGGYGPIAAHAIHVDTPGLGSVDLSRFPFAKVTRPIFPHDPEMSWS